MEAGGPQKELSRETNMILNISKRAQVVVKIESRT